jgi:hypothetical protein
VRSARSPWGTMGPRAHAAKSLAFGLTGSRWSGRAFPGRKRARMPWASPPCVCFRFCDWLPKAVLSLRGGGAGGGRKARRNTTHTKFHSPLSPHPSAPGAWFGAARGAWFAARQCPPGMVLGTRTRWNQEPPLDLRSPCLLASACLWAHRFEPPSLALHAPRASHQAGDPKIWRALAPRGAGAGRRAAGHGHGHGPCFLLLA